MTSNIVFITGQSSSNIRTVRNTPGSVRQLGLERHSITFADEHWFLEYNLGRLPMPFPGIKPRIWKPLQQYIFSVHGSRRRCVCRHFKLEEVDLKARRILTNATHLEWQHHSAF